MKRNGLLIIFSGPSGAGKGTVLKTYLAQHPQARLSVSATTRAPRPGEENGRDYYFVSNEEFDRMQRENELLENAAYCGNHYGTPRAPIEAWLRDGHDVFLEIEVQGGAQVRRLQPESVGIFILPPSVEVLERRLRGRGTEPEAVVQSRLNAAKAEIRQAVQYDYVVVNDVLEEAAAQIAGILEAEKRRASRNAALIERVLQHD